MAAPSAREAGKAAFNRGDYAAAVECYTAALRHEPASDILFCNRSLAHLEAGAPEAALRDALSATTLRPDNVKGWYRKGAALQALGRARAAVVALEQAAAVAPGDEQVQSRLAQARAAAAAERGAAAEAAQQERAQPQPQPSVPAAAPPPPPPPPQQSQQPQNAQASSAALRSLLGITQPGSAAGGKGGKAAAKRGAGGKGGGVQAPKAAAPKPKPPKRVMWADEVEELEEAPAAAPQPASAVAADGAAAFAARGAAAFRVADFAAALSFYTEALSVQPNDAQLLCNRSAAAHGLGLFDAAYADAIAAVEAAPERGKCHVRAGTAAAALRRWPEAAAAYERALAIMPGADDARQRLAMVQAAMMAESSASLRVEQNDVATPSHVEEAHAVSTPPGLSPEPARASDSDDGGEHSIDQRGSACVAAPTAETDADAAALAAALATAARCSDALSARAAALARRVAQLEAELAAARGARCGHCGRCGFASSS